MNRVRWTSLLGAAIVCAATITVPSSFAAVDAKGFTILKPDELVWQHNAEGPDFAFIYGDPQKPGFYIVRARFAPGVMSKPHYHPTDRYVTVISGTWWAGTSADGDKTKTVPLTAGSYMIHPAGAVHFDGAKDIEAIVEIKASGPLRRSPQESEMKKDSNHSSLEPVAGNGLLHRRLFLTQGAAALGSGVALLAARNASAAPLEVPTTMKTPGVPASGYGERSHFESKVQRITNGAPPTPGTGGSRTPLEHLEGIITPNALHFERHHNGVPDIDPEQHRVLIHGLVERPLVFSLDALSRYPLVSKIQFLECSGNSAGMNAPEPAQQGAGGLHGLVSCANWTGVPLAILLQEAGVKAEGKWLLAEGADAAGMSRSVPLAKAYDDAILALYQNGERIRPSNGYPVRLFLPGYEGNMNVKWLRRIKITAEPTMTKDETSKYTDLLPNGRAEMFTFPMGVKSVITSPSGTQKMQGAGLYQISGIAWSGSGKIRRVDVSADRGKTWAQAKLDEPVLTKAVVRFRLPWKWDGSPSVLMSRATDDTGSVQPTRAKLIADRGANYRYHYNAIQSWNVTGAGEIGNVYV